MNETAIHILTIDHFSPEEMEHIVNNSQTEHTQISPGVMSGKALRSTYDETTLDWGTYDRSIMAKGEIDKNAVTFAFVVPKVKGGIYRGTHIDYPTLSIHTEGSELDLILLANSEWGAFHVPRETLENLGFDAPSYFEGPLDIQPELSKITCMQVKSIIKNLLEKTTTTTDTMLSDQLIAEAHEEVIAAYLSVLTPLTSIKEAMTSSAKFRSHVKRAQKYMLEHLAEPIKLSVLCKSIGMSYKTLERAFKHQTGMLPYRYIECLRLTQLRKRLLLANPDNATVSGLAMKCGFNHMGRLSQRYFNMFGELPSETFHRSNSNNRSIITLL